MAHVGAGSDEARTALFLEAFDRGLTSVDTAPLYGFGRSERLLGRALTQTQRPVQVLSKVGLRWGPDARGEVLFETPQRRVVKDSRPAMVRRDVEESLERLGLEALDLVQVHHPDPRTPLDETFGALADLYREGRVRHIGASNFTLAQLDAARAALDPVPLYSTQERYSLVYRDVERAHLPYGRRHGVRLLAYSPLAQGLLAGKLLLGGRVRGDDFRAEDPSFHPANLARIHRAMRRALDPVALAHGAPLASVALAWLVAQPGVEAAVAGARDRAQLDGLLRARRLTLTRAERLRIRDAFEAAPIDRDAGRGPARRALRRVRRWSRRLLRADG